MKRVKEIRVDLDLNKPVDAKIFLTEALPEALGRSDVNHVIYSDGTRKTFNEMTDNELVNAAWDLLPLFKAAFPNNVEVQYEH